MQDVLLAHYHHTSEPLQQKKKKKTGSEFRESKRKSKAKIYNVSPGLHSDGIPSL